jgi:hypothetical protein
MKRIMTQGKTPERRTLDGDELHSVRICDTVCCSCGCAVEVVVGIRV